jgi:spore maturation protein CgeB
MRIFYAVPGTAHQTCLPQSNLWHVNLYMPLRDLGHEIVIFDYDFSEANLHLDPAVPEDAAHIAKNRPRLSEELLCQIKAAHTTRPIDLFFSYFYSAYVEPEAVREISRLGIVTVNWYCNGSYQFQLVEEIAPSYDYCLVPEKFRLTDYRRVGANPIYCQEAANPTVYKPYDLPIEYDVTFVGQRYGDRPYYISKLIDEGIDARVWGPHWQDPVPEVPLWRRLGRSVKQVLGGTPDWASAVVPGEYCGPPLSDDEFIKIYSRSRISLGFSNVAYIPRNGEPIKQVRLRDFEAPMSGAFYMVQYFDELTDFFDPDREIVCFSEVAELVDKARFYLRHSAEREKIRMAGTQRARSEHTWHKRFEMVFREIGLT